MVDTNAANGDGVCCEVWWSEKKWESREKKKEKKEKKKKEEKKGEREKKKGGSQRSEAQEAKLRPILLHDEDRVEGLLCCRVACCGGNTYIWSSWVIPEAQNRMNNFLGWRGQKMVEAKIW